MTVLAVLAALTLGSALGWLCRLVPVRPAAQDLAATVIGWVVGSAVRVVVTVLTFRLPDSGGLGAVSFGISEAIVFWIPILILLALVARLALHRLGAMGPAILGTHPSIFLGGVAAVVGALSTARGIVVSPAG